MTERFGARAEHAAEETGIGCACAGAMTVRHEGLYFTRSSPLKGFFDSPAS